MNPKMEVLMGKNNMARIRHHRRRLAADRRRGDIWNFEIATRTINDFMYYYCIFRNKRTGEIVWGDRIGKDKDTWIEITAS